MAENSSNSSNEFFTPENPNIQAYAYRHMPKVDNTGNAEKDYILLYPETISENVLYKNSGKNLRTVAQALNYILETDFDKSINDQAPGFTPTESLIELFQGDTLSVMAGKLATSIIELKALLNFIGRSPIEDIGDGTITGAISFLNEQFTDNYGNIVQAIDAVNRTVV